MRVTTPYLLVVRVAFLYFVLLYDFWRRQDIHVYAHVLESIYHQTHLHNLRDTSTQSSSPELSDIAPIPLAAGSL